MKEPLKCDHCERDDQGSFRVIGDRCRYGDCEGRLVSGTLPTTELYFESHVTIDPIEEDRREFLSESLRPWGFKLAELLLRKGRTASTDDAFMTGRGTDYLDIKSRTRGVVEMLIQRGFRVRRYKIENTLLDSKHKASGDVFGLLP